MKLFVALLTTVTMPAALAIDEEACRRLANKQVENVVPDYQPLDQGNAGLCSSFAMSLSISGALGKQGAESVSPLSLARSLEDWKKNSGKKEEVKSRLNFIGDNVDKNSRFEVMDQQLNARLTGRMSTTSSGVTAEEASADNYGVNSYMNKAMEGVPLSDLAAAVSASGQGCSQSGSKFAGTPISQWTNNERKNYSSFTSMEDNTREDGDVSFLMGQLSHLYDTNKELKRRSPAFSDGKLATIMKRVKNVCDNQFTKVISERLQLEADKLNPCKLPTRFGENNREAVCRSGVFKPRMSAEEFVRQNKGKLMNGEGMKELMLDLQKEFLPTQVSEKYLNEVKGNIDAGVAKEDTFVPHDLAQKIASHKKKLAELPPDATDKAKKDAAFQLKNLEEQAALIKERGKQFFVGQSKAEQIAEQVEQALEAGTGAKIDVKTEERPIVGNPREYDQKFLQLAGIGDAKFNSNEAEIQRLEEELVKIEGKGKTIGIENSLTRTGQATSDNSRSLPLIRELKHKIQKRKELVRSLNKKNIPKELLNEAGDLKVSFNSISSYLKKAAAADSKGNLKDFHTQAHNAVLHQEIGKDVAALFNSWSSTEKKLTHEEFKAKAARIAEKIRGGRLGPEYNNLPASYLSGIKEEVLDKLLSLDPNSPAMGDLLYGMKKASDRSGAIKTPVDFLKNIDLNGDGKPDDDSYALANIEPFKSNAYAKSLLENVAIKDAYYTTYKDIMRADSSYAEGKNKVSIERADLRYKNLNDCLSQNIEYQVKNEFPNPSCDQDDLIFSMSSLASLSDDADKIMASLDAAPENFWDQVMSCDDGKQVDLGALKFDIYQLSKASDERKKDEMLVKALEDSVLKGTPLTLGMCLSALSEGKCEENKGDLHAMAVVGFDAKWDAQKKSCAVNYKLANSWGKRCDKRVDGSKTGVKCDQNTGIITVPHNVIQQGGIQMSVAKKN